MKKLIVPLVVVVLVAGACLSLGNSDELSDMEIRAQAGTVLIHRGEEDPIEVRDQAVPLEVGDVVETARRGLADLRLADGRDIKMQPNTEIAIDSTRAVTSEHGSVLIDAPARTIVVVDQVEASGTDAHFRVDSGFGSTRIGSYSGRVALTSPGQAPLQVDRLHQSTVAAGDLGNEVPYRIDMNDPWDLDVLERVVELENELDLLAQGFTRLLGNDRPDVAYFRALAGGRDVSFVSRYLRRRPIDLLIGFTIAEHAAGPLKKAFHSAFGYRDQGATWGIAAAIMRVEPRPVVAQLEDVILGTGVVADGGTSDEAEFSVAAAQATEDNAPISGADGGDTNQPIVNDPGGEDPGGEDPGDGNDGEDPDDGEGGGGGDDEDCEDVECVVRRAISPSPSPTGVLDGTVDIGGKGLYVPLSR